MGKRASSHSPKACLNNQLCDGTPRFLHGVDDRNRATVSGTRSWEGSLSDRRIQPNREANEERGKRIESRGGHQHEAEGDRRVCHRCAGRTDRPVGSWCARARSRRRERGRHQDHHSGHQEGERGGVKHRGEQRTPHRTAAPTEGSRLVIKPNLTRFPRGMRGSPPFASLPGPPRAGPRNSRATDVIGDVPVRCAPF